MEPETPIEVGSPVPAQLAQALRSLLIALGAFAAGKGWIDQDVATALVPVALIVGPIVWGQMMARRNNAEKRVMADALPDSIATTK